MPNLKQNFANLEADLFHKVFAKGPIRIWSWLYYESETRRKSLQTNTRRYAWETIQSWELVTGYIGHRFESIL